MSKDDDLTTHVAVCNERYCSIISKLDQINIRLDKLNGRWWKVLSATIGLLLTGLGSAIAYIWVNTI
jgi:hypothetical protein